MPLCSATVPWPPFSQQLVIVPVKRHAAGAMHGELVVDGAGFQARQRHDRLESRAGRLLRLNGPIQHRIVGVVGDLFPILALDAHGEFVGVEGRAG